MKVELYQTLSEKNRLTKILTNKLDLTGHLKDDCNMTDPVITFNLDNNILVYNYAYIPAFQRYYFINDVDIINKTMQLSLHIDVLMTYKNDILNSTGLVIRSAVGDSYIPDRLVLQTKKITRQCQQIGNSFNKKDGFVLQLGG